MRKNLIESTPRFNTWTIIIDICDLFFIIKDYDIENYADDNIPYLRGKNIEEVSNGLRICFQTYFNCLLKTN